MNNKAGFGNDIFEQYKKEEEKIEQTFFVILPGQSGRIQVPFAALPVLDALVEPEHDGNGHGNVDARSNQSMTAKDYKNEQN